MHNLGLVLFEVQLHWVCKEQQLWIGQSQVFSILIVDQLIQ